MIWLKSLMKFLNCMLVLLLLQNVGCSAPQSAESSEPLVTPAQSLILSPSYSQLTSTDQWPDIGVTLLSRSGNLCKSVSFAILDPNAQGQSLKLYESTSSNLASISNTDLSTVMGTPSLGSYEIEVTCVAPDNSVYVDSLELEVVNPADSYNLEFTQVNSQTPPTGPNATKINVARSDKWITNSVSCTDGQDVQISVFVASGLYLNELSLPIKAPCYGGNFTASFSFPDTLGAGAKVGDLVVMKAQSLDSTTGEVMAESSIILGVGSD